MRFVLAIVAFVAAALMIGFGVAQRTILLPPDQVSLSVGVTDDASLTVIDGSVLNAFPGSQTLTISGEGDVFAGYGRTADVMAWVGQNEHTRITIDEESGELVARHVDGLPASDPAAGQEEGEQPAAAPEEPAEGQEPRVEPAPTFLPVPNPTGSDLWLDDYVETGSLRLTVNVPADITVLLASDGTAPAPGQVKLTWPVDNSTPFAIPLIVGGAVVLLLGLAALAWAILHMRSMHGPRRKPGKMPKLPRRPRTPKPSRKAIEQKASGQNASGQKASGRRAAGRTGMVAVPIVLIGALALSGCSVTPKPQPTPAPTETATPDAPHLPPPAATARQIDRVVAHAIEVAATADEELDTELIATRFGGPALTLRLADYEIRDEDSKITSTVPQLPRGTVKLMLPQQTTDWPRTVMAIVQDATDATVPPVSLMLVQTEPRENYKVHYAVALEPGVTFPEVAPASLGAARLSADSSVLKTAPNMLALAYADILAKDIESQIYLDFEPEGDSLRAAVGLEAREKRADDLPSTAKMVFSEQAGTESPIALATNDSGAVVAVELLDSAEAVPVEEGAAVNTEGAVKALSGLAMSTDGVRATYQLQLLFYVPAADGDGKIVLLGWSQGLVEAEEVK